MDDNTSIQFRLRLAQINGIKINEEQIAEATIDSRVERQKATSKIISHMLNDDNKDVRIAAISHPNATAEHITHALKDKDEDVRTHAMRHRNVTPDHITQALKDKDSSVRGIAILHPNATAEHITHALKDKAPGVRMNAISHPNATPEHITHALKDNFSLTRAAAVRNPNATPEHIKQGLKDKDSYVRSVGKERIHRVNKVNEEQIDEVKRSADYLHSTATEDQRAPTLKTYHTAMAKYSNLPPRAAHIKALNDTIDKHGVKNANQHVTKHFYSQMQKHLSDED